MLIESNEDILSACLSLVDETQLCVEERSLLAGINPLASADTEELKETICSGRDVLGDAYIRITDACSRRTGGETYTPDAIVSRMIAAASEMRTPQRVVDVGCGSGRFSVACARAFPNARIVAIDSSPIATLMCKATVRALGLSNRVDVVLDDFTTTEIAPSSSDETTLWIGNPPYVRHHDISPDAKQWLKTQASAMGLKASALSGLHAYFTLAIADRWSPFFEEKTTLLSPAGYVRLGDIARVHRGIVTGANKFWVRKICEEPLADFAIPVVSHAREVIESSDVVEEDGLARLVVLPEDLDSLDSRHVTSVHRLIAEGRELDIGKGYVARARRCWWSIPIGEPAPILMTYMARRPPAFVANPHKTARLTWFTAFTPSLNCRIALFASLWRI